MGWRHRFRDERQILHPILYLGCVVLHKHPSFMAYFFTEQHRKSGFLDVHWILTLAFATMFLLFSAGMFGSTFQLAAIKILSEAARRAESSKKNATTIDLYDLRLLAILTTRMAHDPDDVLRLYVGPNMGWLPNIS
jgi:hypothetical protein